MNLSKSAISLARLALSNELSRLSDLPAFCRNDDHLLTVEAVQASYNELLEYCFETYGVFS